jgi:hypothetical protein
LGADAGDGNVPLFDSAGVLDLMYSIIWAPGRDVIGGHVPSALLADHLLLHDATDFPLLPDIRTGNPRFVGPLAGNFRLVPLSPAIDSAPTVFDPPHDLAGSLRVVDIFDVSNDSGPMDLGAFELQRQKSNDFIFADGFE